MKKLTINCQTGKQEYIKMTPKEEAERLAEIEVARLAEIEKQQQEQEKKDALERLKKSANKDIIDLLAAFD